MGAFMIALEARNLTKSRTLLDEFDSEETFNELRSDLSTGKQLACYAAQTVLTNTEPYKKPSPGRRSQKPEPMVNAAVIINDELLPEGEEYAPAVLQWLNDAARQLELSNPQYNRPNARESNNAIMPQPRIQCCWPGCRKARKVDPVKWAYYNDECAGARP